MITAASEYSTMEVAEMTGLTYRQLTYWASNDVLVPSIKPSCGSGSRAIYNHDDVYVARLLKQVTTYFDHMPLAQLRQIDDSARDMLMHIDSRLDHSSVMAGEAPETIYLIFITPEDIHVTDRLADGHPHFVVHL